MADSFGIYRETATIVRSYKNGVQVERRGHPDCTGDSTSVSVLNNPTIPVHVDRIEWRTRPFGTLLGAWDWDDLTGWTAVLGAGGGFTIDPAGHVRGVDDGAVSWLHQLQPTPYPGYVELQGVYWDSVGAVDDKWVMVSMWQSNTAAPGGETGYRVLLRNYPAGTIFLPDATDVLDPGDPIVPGNAWRVGSIGFPA